MSPLKRGLCEKKTWLYTTNGSVTQREGLSKSTRFQNHVASCCGVYKIIKNEYRYVYPSETVKIYIFQKVGCVDHLSSVIIPLSPCFCSMVTISTNSFTISLHFVGTMECTTVVLMINIMLSSQIKLCQNEISSILYYLFKNALLNCALHIAHSKIYLGDGSLSCPASALRTQTMSESFHSNVAMIPCVRQGFATCILVILYVRRVVRISSGFQYHLLLMSDRDVNWPRSVL